jgi:glycogen debranching enzyme
VNAPESLPMPLLEACSQASLRLLQQNLSRGGILAASRTAAAEARRYTRVFGRDAAICVLGMCGSGVPELEDAAIESLDTLAAHQGANGQIAKYVDTDQQEADFWYLGCIDATLWWLIAADHVRRHTPGTAGRWQVEIERGIAWLLAQEHQHFRLLQQNEASDWADIMPRSGFVLYTNALWYAVKRRFALPDAEATRRHFNHLFHPERREMPEYHRARLLRHYVGRGARDRGMYLSFVNFASGGDEGDVFGNVLTVLCGLTMDSMGHRIAETLQKARAADPYPIRVVLHPMSRQHPQWRAYMGRHQLNHPHQYHNGGIWPFVGAFWAMALARLGHTEWAWRELGRVARANERDGWRFTEWFHGRTVAAQGMPGQSWNAAAYLFAQRALLGDDLFAPFA